ncbi:MAG: phosphopantetheine-binding protein [Zoogloeaceae bacterium]|jgi:acyl carrier protein|nr:phosphopantetheine-binding protein [Zoogloeaceae bacterium]
MSAPLTRDAALTLIADILAQLFEADASAITPETHLYQDLDIDSIDAVDLSIEFKKRTGRQLTPEEFKQIRTVGDVVNLLCGTD